MTVRGGSAYFDYERELRCRCGHCSGGEVDPRLLVVITQFRVAWGRPLIVNSCCRCPAHNAAEGGKRTSRHLTQWNGTDRLVDAIDFAMPENDLVRKFLKLIFIMDLWGGIGIDPKFVHLDLGSVKKAWVYAHQ